MLIVEDGADVVHVHQAFACDLGVDEYDDDLLDSYDDYYDNQNCYG